LRSFVRDAVALRAREPALRQVGYERLGSSGAACAFARGDGDRRLVVVVNAGEQAVDLTVPLPAEALHAPSALTVGNVPSVLGGDDASSRLRLAPRSAAVKPVHA
jgi:hypothetical protein